MINFICGEVVSIEDNTVVIKNNDIGYGLTVSSATASALSIGETVQLYCHLQVREDCLVLFGFKTPEERTMFYNLISVSGIGPKMATTILSGISTRDLAMAIINSSTSTLCSIKGLGKKSAERVILELREKLSITDYAQTSFVGEKLSEEAIFVLTSLGIKRTEAKERVKLALEAGLSTTEAVLDFCIKNF